MSGHLGHVGHLGDRIPQLRGELPQLIVAVARRHSVTARIGTSSIERGLTSGPDDAGRDAVRIGGQLLVEADECRFLGSSTLKRTTTIDWPGLDVE